MSRFRLSAQPGLIRAGQHINTGVQPYLVQTNNGMQVQTAIQALGLVAQPIPAKTAVPNAVPKSISTPLPQPLTVPNRPAVAPASVQLNGDAIRKTIVNYHQSEYTRREEEESQRYKDVINGIKNTGRGKLLVVIANGPSINEAALDKLKDHPVIDMMSINKPDPRVYPTPYWIFCDQSQYQRNEALFNSYKGTVINAWSVKAKHPNQVLIRILSGKGFSKNLLYGFYIGRSTTYAAMQVGYWMGYERVYIFGCDMCAVNGETHYYGVNPDVDAETRVNRFKREAEFYLDAAKQLNAEERQKYVFCSSYNQFEFMTYFERMHQVEAVDKILSLANSQRGV